jgi:aspartyl protease family protein
VTDGSAQIIFYLVALILPLSALVARRLPAREVLKYALAWIAIFGLGYLLYVSFT